MSDSLQLILPFVCLPVKVLSFVTKGQQLVVRWSHVVLFFFFSLFSFLVLAAHLARFHVKGTFLAPCKQKVQHLEILAYFCFYWSSEKHFYSFARGLDPSWPRSRAKKKKKEKTPERRLKVRSRSNLFFFLKLADL